MKGLLQNPLLLATSAGILFNLAGLQVPELAGAILARLGNSSIALGLIMVGAGLRLSGLHEAKGISAWFLAVKLLALPALAYGLGRWIGLTGLQLQIAVMFCALPTASSAYVLATRMGGNGPVVAFLISGGTSAVGGDAAVLAGADAVNPLLKLPLKLLLPLTLTCSAWDAAVCAAQKMDQKRNMSERSELVSFPDFLCRTNGKPKASVLAVAFFCLLFLARQEK